MSSSGPHRGPDHGPDQPAGSYPPPGSGQQPWSPPAQGPASSSSPPWATGGAAPAPPPPGAAHRPGAVALRPLRLGDVFDAAFRVIRFNPGATIGAAFLIALVAMALPVAVTSLAAPASTGLLDPGAPGGLAGDPATPQELSRLVGALWPLLLGSLLLQVGVILLTGVITHVVHAAAVGRKIGLAEAWAATHGRRWRLVGLVLALAVPVVAGVLACLVPVVAVAAAGFGPATVITVAVLSLLVLVAALVLYYVRCTLLAPVALMLEDLGVLRAVARGYRLTAGQFWRVLGIAVLTSIVVQVAAAVLGFPIGLLGQLGAVALPEETVLVVVLTQALSTVVTTALTAPFTAAVTTLLYLDQRMRKEAYDVELMAQAQVTEG